MKKILAAAAQINTISDMDANIEKMLRMCEEASHAGAQLIVFPETSNYIGPHLVAHGIDVPGRETDVFSKAAAENKMYIHIGSFTEKIPGCKKAGNLSMLFSPNGEMVGKYRKIHLFDADIPGGVSYTESATIVPGNKIVSVKTDIGEIGFGICFDIRFPELFRSMALKGTEIFTVAANFSGATGKRSWEASVKTRAMENTCYMIASDQCGVNAAFPAFGHSMIVSPLGDVLAEAENEETVIYAELDPKVLEDSRWQLPLLKIRRPDIYL